jgi:23S rRNA (cytidine1920-2'-O)/16S rRNA (cytidine1409-2'-O)-methyltransferase
MQEVSAQRREARRAARAGPPPADSTASPTVEASDAAPRSKDSTPRGRRRLDALLVERGAAESRQRAQAMILAGEVSVAGYPSLKPGSQVAADAILELRAAPRYVSRGGLKLERALDAFQIDVTGRIALDVGASTGGFTDVLLQRSVSRVYAVDVGYGQLDYRLRSDPRVTVLDRTNIRYLQELPERPNLCVIDVSFISLRLVLPSVRALLAPGADIVALVKPQFEAGRGAVGRGVIRSPLVWRRVLEDLDGWLAASGWTIQDLEVSPVRGASGNVEFLAHVRCEPALLADAGMIDKALKAAEDLT